MLKFVLATMLLFFVNQSAFAYLTFSASALRSVSMAKVKQGTFKICLTGSASRPDMERAKDWAVRSTVAWFRVYKQIDATMPTQIELSCESPALTITLLNGSGRSYAQAGKTWIYNEVAYGTWTHELGHAVVGLGDTYTGSRAGACRSGQPESLMCWGGYGPRRDHNVYSTLWEDDVAGAIYTYQVIHGFTTPSPFTEGFDLFKTFDLANPYPKPVSTISLKETDHEVDVDEFGELTPINPHAEFE